MLVLPLPKILDFAGDVQRSASRLQPQLDSFGLTSDSKFLSRPQPLKALHCKASIGSPKAVPVPWHLMWDLNRSSEAQNRPWCQQGACQGTFGTDLMNSRLHITSSFERAPSPQFGSASARLHDARRDRTTAGCKGGKEHLRSATGWRLSGRYSDVSRGWGGWIG